MKSWTRSHLLWYRVLGLCALSAGCQDDRPRDFEVVAELPHDPSAYTQGLIYLDGVFYESTGRYGLSDVRRVNPLNAGVLQSVRLPPVRFGEGIAIHGDRLFQLTWKEHVAYVYQLPALTLIDSFGFTGEGWGLTSDGESLIMSDGTATLRFLNPADFTEKKRVTVTADGSELKAINELEMIRGELWANIYQSDYLVRIDPLSGRVTRWHDLEGLLPVSLKQGTDVLNGIAWDSAGDRLFITGKLWPRVYQIRFP